MSGQLGRLPEIAVRERLISMEQLQKAQAHEREKGGDLRFSIIKLGYVSEDEMMEFLAKWFGHTALGLVGYTIDAETLAILTGEQARHYRVVPINFPDASTLVVAAYDLTKDDLDNLTFLTGRNIVAVQTYKSIIAQALDRFYPA